MALINTHFKPRGLVCLASSGTAVATGNARSVERELNFIKLIKRMTKRIIVK